MRVKLYNNFHGTEVSLNLKTINKRGVISPSQLERAVKVLCGVKECCCCNALGVRGPQDYDIIAVAPKNYHIYLRS